MKTMFAVRSIPLIRVIVVIAIAASGAGCRIVRTPRQTLEMDFRDRGFVLHQVPYHLPADVPARSIRFDRELLSRAALYLRGNEKGRYIYIDGHGGVFRDGQRRDSLRENGELLLTPAEWVVYVDGKPLPGNVRGWDVYWVTADDAPPPEPEHIRYPRVELNDSFMRTTLTNDTCRITRGDWALCRHGGGMPDNAGEYADAGFQRAVNPFSAAGSSGGILSYGTDRWINYHGEACYYFGRPHTNHVVDTDTLPLDTDMMVAQGATNGAQIAFGWQGARAAFVLLARDGAGPWQRLATARDHARPPLTDWFRLGLRIHGGRAVEALLDGVTVFRTNVATRVAGPFHLLAGRRMVEADSIRAYSLPGTPSPGGALYVKSRFFSSKKELGDRDPEQFGEWSRSTSAFDQSRAEVNDESRALITTRFPVMGDFTMEPVPFDDAAGALRQGRYVFGFGTEPGHGAPATNVFIEAELNGDGWRLDGLPPAAWPEGHREFPLRFSRWAATGSRVAAERDGTFYPVSPALEGPLHVSIARVGKAGAKPDFPHPAHFPIRVVNLINEFFEEAPADWSWIDGAFRMDCRWACQDQWNFMACGSPRLPYMTSKRTFSGNQVHECFMSLRPARPWDAGDATFEYDRNKDGNLQIFHANGGWYVRRDLNVAFCTDGRNPLSGYALVFGGDDNSETRLLRRGRVVAKTTDEEFLLPKKPGHAAVHWKWWKFTIYKQGARIRCFLNDMQIFDYTDPEPLPGGHMGFWSVRNAFTLARVTSMAETIGDEPRVLYVADDAPSEWRPLLHDGVSLARDPKSRQTIVTNNVGGGVFAVRYTPPRPISLARTPVMKLPIRFPFEAAVNVHIDIGGMGFVVPVSAPLSGMKALLTPEFERGECFRLPTMEQTEVLASRYLDQARLYPGGVTINLEEALKTSGKSPPGLEVRSITVGNSSNQGYLLAGADGRNRAGTWYAVGIPEFHEAQ